MENVNAKDVNYGVSIANQDMSNVKEFNDLSFEETDSESNSDSDSYFDVVYDEIEGTETQFKASFYNHKISSNSKNLKQASNSRINNLPTRVNRASGGILLGYFTPTESGFNFGFTNTGKALYAVTCHINIYSTSGKLLKSANKLIAKVPNGQSSYTWSIPKQKTVQERVEFSGDGNNIGTWARFSTTVQRYNFKGGRYSKIEPLDGERHHMPSVAASPLSKGKGPVITMLKSEHKGTASWGNTSNSRDFAAKEKTLIKQGKFLAAQNLGINDVRNKFGSKYNKAINQMKKYTKSLGYTK